MKSEYHVLSLGAGVQSTTVYLLAMERQLELDAAVFADTGDEPQAVYRHLKWLQSLAGPPIYVRTKGRLSEDLMRGGMERKRAGGFRRFVTVPFFIRKPDGELGQTRRQCSKEYKVEVVERAIRRDMVGLGVRQRIPKRVAIHQYFGISTDEARRALRIRERMAERRWEPHFPLIERRWTRADCSRYLESRVPHEVPKSACVFCPFHTDAEWLKVRQNPEDWALAVQVDVGLRKAGVIVNRNMNAAMYAHRSCVPLDEVQFKNERQFNLFTLECEGMCGV
jgi:hypothetical protein